MTHIKAVVFDLFHTLVDPGDFIPPGFRRIQAVSNLMGLDPDDFESYWRSNLERRNSDPGFTVRACLEGYLKANGLPWSEEDLEKAWDIMGLYQERAVISPRPDVVRGLEALRSSGYTLGLLSNADEREANPWPRSPLAPLFDAACFSCHIGYCKPDMRAYNTILNRLSMPPEAACFVGDGGSDELMGARNAGFGLVIHMTRFAEPGRMYSEEDIKENTRISHHACKSMDELVGLLASP